ncbi:MAG: glutamate 5-kinase [Candidatus Firestonebacteria bacterium]
MYKRIVVKIGTNLLADKVKGINTTRVLKIAEVLSGLEKSGRDICLVTSGAIGAGIAALKLKKKPETIPEKQATASIGQPLLMEAYERAFRKYKAVIGQILLTKDDFTDRKRYLNAKNTFDVLLKKRVVPVINENDTIAVDEIKVGDNDNISAMVAHLVGADLLIILSDIKGLCREDPNKNADTELIPLVKKITPEIEKLARRSKGELSAGGMATKLQAAKKCAAAGITMVIADGKDPSVIKSIVLGEPNGTIFLPCNNKLTDHEIWKLMHGNLSK